MFVAALFTTVKRWTQPKCSMTDEWINKTWHVFIMEYYSTMKRDKILIPTTMWWMNVTNILPSEISWTPKDKDCLIPHIWGPENRQVQAAGK